MRKGCRLEGIEEPTEHYDQDWSTYRRVVLALYVYETETLSVD